jgi:hypothetical protein
MSSNCIRATTESFTEDEIEEFVGVELKNYKHLNELKNFILEHAISGSLFLELTNQSLENWGTRCSWKKT